MIIFWPNRQPSNIRLGLVGLANSCLLNQDWENPSLRIKTRFGSVLINLNKSIRVDMEFVYQKHTKISQNIVITCIYRKWDCYIINISWILINRLGFKLIYEIRVRFLINHARIILGLLRFGFWTGQMNTQSFIRPKSTHIFPILVSQSVCN